MSKEIIIICQICKGTFKNLGMHLKHKHQLTSKEYYDIYLKEEGEGICLTCGEETTFLRGQYNTFCSVKCSNKNPELIEQRIENYLKALDDDPSISKNRTEKYLQTLADDSSIVINREIKKKKTLAENPEIMKEMSKKCLKTYKDNPDISKNRAIKQKKTLDDNPEIVEKRNEKSSITRRNIYKSLCKDYSEETHYLYIMENQTRPIIKIGLTSVKNLQLRIGAIRRDFGESVPVLLLKSTHKNIDGLETFLHDYFNDYCKVQPERKSGRTEWFDKKIMEEAILLASSELKEIT